MCGGLNANVTTRVIDTGWICAPEEDQKEVLARVGDENAEPVTHGLGRDGAYAALRMEMTGRYWDSC